MNRIRFEKNVAEIALFKIGLVALVYSPQVDIHGL